MIEECRDVKLTSKAVNKLGFRSGFGPIETLCTVELKIWRFLHSLKVREKETIYLFEGLRLVNI